MSAISLPEKPVFIPATRAEPRPWPTLALFTGLSLACWIDRFILSALLTPIKSELGLRDEQVGRIEFAFTIAYVFSAPVFGYLGDRFPRKGLILLALLLWSLASMGSGLAFALAPLLFWRALVGAGEGAYQSLAPSWLADVFVPRVRNIAIAVFNSSSKIGATIGVAAGGFIAAHAKWGWHAAFLASGIPGLFLIFFLLRAREPRRGAADEAPETARERPTLKGSLSLLGLPHYRLHLAGYTAYYVAISTLFLWGPAYMHRTFGVLNAEAAGFFGLAYTLTGLPGVYLGGWAGSLLRRRSPAGYAAILAATMGALTLVLLFLLTRHDIGAFRGAVWAEIFLFGFGSATTTTLIFDTVPVALRGVAVALGLIAYGGIGGVVSSEGVGFLSDHFGLRNALFLAPATTLAATLSWARLGWRQRIEPAPAR